MTSSLTVIARGYARHTVCVFVSVTACVESSAVSRVGPRENEFSTKACYAPRSDHSSTDRSKRRADLNAALRRPACQGPRASPIAVLLLHLHLLVLAAPIPTGLGGGESTVRCDSGSPWSAERGDEEREQSTRRASLRHCSGRCAGGRTTTTTTAAWSAAAVLASASSAAVHRHRRVGAGLVEARVEAGVLQGRRPPCSCRWRSRRQCR